ncbi:MAG: response regulator [Desulfosarcina sp.]|nr:response regulator [Desulfobacterales bacterium]
MEEKKILFVDDDKAQRGIINDIIKKLGYTVETVGSSEEAMKILAKHKYPLIITDLKMPGIDGMELCKRIREIGSESVIYALSGHVAEFDPELFEEIGFDGHLCKPVKIKVLKLAIEGAFEQLCNGMREAE